MFQHLAAIAVTNSEMCYDGAELVNVDSLPDE